MRSGAPHPSVPAEALARQSRLQTALRAMEEAGGSLEPACLQRLHRALTDAPAVDLECLSLELIAEELVEEAVELLRAARRDANAKTTVDFLATRLSPLAAKAHLRRSALWQLDTRRARVQLTFSKLEEALDFDDGDLHAIFLHAFRLEGLRLVLDLGKRPRPLLTLGMPLPAGVGGLAERMSAVLKQEPQGDSLAVLERLNQRLPAGLRIHQWQGIPAYASELADLALRSWWRWEVLPQRRTSIEGILVAFHQSVVWPWERGAAKADVPLDLRNLILDAHWSEGALCFATPMGIHQAINPLKMLGALLGLAPSDIPGLVRTGVDLKPDTRIAQSDRFAPKLKNMYEDAVLLGGGSNIVLVDEDDDEPIQLGPRD